MIMPRVKKKTKNKKKHVETMFLTQKKKNHPYYFKSKIKSNLYENNLSLLTLKRRTFSIRCVKSGIIEVDSLKAVVRLFKWYLKKYNLEDFLSLKFNIFPDFVLTSKPKSMRMGKGKGGPDRKIAPVKRGTIILYLNVLTRNRIVIFTAFTLINKMIFKLPLTCKLCYNF
jgi:ribosomal protein L16/L10AE